MLPLVSIILTVYKRTKYIKNALQSALDQSFQSFEIIVTDDSNSAEIKAICDSFNDPKIRYRNNLTNVGVALNVRTAIDESQGKYIAILNDDDCWESNFLEKMVAPLERNPNLVLAFSNHWVINDKGEKNLTDTVESANDYGRRDLPEGELSHLEDFVLKKNGVPLAMSAVFRKDGLDLDLLVKEVSGAYDFWISCMLAATKRPAYFIPEKLTQYRNHGEMETNRKAPDKKANLLYIYKELIDMNLFPKNRSFLTINYSRVLRYAGVDNISFNNVAVARGYFLKSLRVYPSFRSIGALAISFLPGNLRLQLLKFKKKFI